MLPRLTDMASGAITPVSAGLVYHQVKTDEDKLQERIQRSIQRSIAREYDNKINVCRFQNSRRRQLIGREAAAISHAQIAVCATGIHPFQRLPVVRSAGIVVHQPEPTFLISLHFHAFEISGCA